MAGDTITITHDDVFKSNMLHCNLRHDIESLTDYLTGEEYGKYVINWDLLRSVDELQSYESMVGILFLNSRPGEMIISKYPCLSYFNIKLVNVSDIFDFRKGDTTDNDN